jgi:hypothetical protein
MRLPHYEVGAHVQKQQLPTGLHSCVSPCLQCLVDATRVALMCRTLIAPAQHGSDHPTQ